MKQVEVRASKNYTVSIGSDILSQAGEYVSLLTKARSACIVSDSNVWPLYGKTVADSLQANGIDSVSFVFPAGENSKSAEVYLALLNFLAENRITRSDCMIALGGGVVGDLAGFASATYLRGIAYIQMPTTLLAMVDSSVGGKTAINLPAGKNLAGAFYQPTAVLCDTDALKTLPRESFLDGCGEVIKYGILFDPALFSHLEETGTAFDREAVISRCIEHKRNVVAQDEFDKGQRMLLNLGHTIGHAIEKCSDYSVSHGCAVAIGMAMVCRAAHCSDSQRITALLEQFGLPVTTDISPDALCAAALSDKKRIGDAAQLILPASIGDCVVTPIAISDLKTFIEEGM